MHAFPFETSARMTILAFIQRLREHTAEAQSILDAIRGQTPSSYPCPPFLAPRERIPAHFTAPWNYTPGAQSASSQPPQSQPAWVPLRAMGPVPIDLGGQTPP